MLVRCICVVAVVAGAAVAAVAVVDLMLSPPPFPLIVTPSFYPPLPSPPPPAPSTPSPPSSPLLIVDEKSS